MIAPTRIAPVDGLREAAVAPSRAPLLARLPPPARDALLERARVERVGPGEFLFREGDEPEGVAIVREGAGEVFRAERGGLQERLGEFEPGDLLAIASTLTGRPHLASARALVPTEILRISRWDVRRLCRRHPEIALCLRERMEDRLEAMLRRMEWLATRATPERDKRPGMGMEHCA